MTGSLPFSSEFQTATGGQSASVGNFLQFAGALPFGSGFAATEADQLRGRRRAESGKHRILSLITNNQKNEKFPDPMCKRGYQDLAGDCKYIFLHVLTYF